MWLTLATDENRGQEVLAANCNGERVLPVFSGEAEAVMFFAWLGGSFEDGWRTRETSAGELVSILCGPCVGVGRVALDPAPEIVEADAITLVSVTRECFLGWVAGGQRPFSRSRAHLTALGGG
jgi:hypothetical protein